ELTGRTDLRRPFLVADIGGGSTEFVLGDDRVRAARSVDVGCVRMTERHLVRDGAVTDPPTAGQVAAMRADIESALDLAEKTVPLREAHTLVGLAGSVTTVSAIAQDLPGYDSAAIHHSRISRERVREISDWLLRSTHAERAAVPSMHPGRVDVIAAGALVLLAVMERVDAREVVASEHDILDGIAWSLAADGPRGGARGRAGAPRCAGRPGCSVERGRERASAGGSPWEGFGRARREKVREVLHKEMGPLGRRMGAG